VGLTADAPAVETEDERAGAKAERLVVERVRAALPPEYRLYPNVKWIGRTADHRGLRDGEADWFDALQLLLVDPADDVMYVFHDPAQALYRDDVVERLRLTPRDLVWNCRNPQAIHEAVARLADGGLSADALRPGGRAPEVIEVSTPAQTLEAMRTLLLRLRHDEKVAARDIAVLSGVGLDHSDVWRQRRFGSETLWNGQVDADGRPNGLAAELVPPQPAGTILCDSIRRFKGLERPVVVLAELPADDPRLKRLLYVGLSRARRHVALVVSVEVAQELRRFSEDSGRSSTQ